MPDGGLRVTDFKTSRPCSISNVFDEAGACSCRCTPVLRITIARCSPVETAATLPLRSARYLHVRDGKPFPAG